MEQFEIIKGDIDFNIYLNIKPLSEVRNIGVSLQNGFDGKESTYPLSEIDFQKKIKSSKHIAVLSGNITFLLIPSNSDSYKKENLAKLVSKVRSEKLIIIKPFKCKIKNVQFPNYEIIDGDIYLIKNWFSENSEKGRSLKVFPKDEWRNNILNTEFYVEIDELPSISSSSQEIVWYGVPVGDVVEITSPSLSSNGYTSSCFRVVN